VEWQGEGIKVGDDDSRNYGGNQYRVWVRVVERERRTTMDGKRFSKCTTNTRNNGRIGVAEDGDGIASSVV